MRTFSNINSMRMCFYNELADLRCSHAASFSVPYEHHAKALNLEDCCSTYLSELVSETFPRAKAQETLMIPNAHQHMRVLADEWRGTQKLSKHTCGHGTFTLHMERGALRGWRRWV